MSENRKLVDFHHEKNGLYYNYLIHIQISRHNRLRPVGLSALLPDKTKAFDVIKASFKLNTLY